MRVAVLGAGGTIAPAIVRDLASSPEVEALLLVDLDGERAAAVAARHGGGKAVATEADARSGLAEILQSSEMLVNSAAYRVNLDAMRACLEARCHYLDLGGLYHVTGKQLELSGEFEQAGLLALLGIGSSPGKTNVLAAMAAGLLDEVEAVHVSAAGRDLNPPPGFSVPYALRTIIDELTLSPVVLRGGAAIEIEAMTDGGMVDFGEPIGHAPTIHTLHSELRTFGDSFGCAEASFRLSLPPQLLERLRELRGAGEAEIEAAARQGVPQSERTVAVHLVEATGGGRTARARSVTKPNRAWGLGGGIVSTAAPAAAAVRLLARGRITARGALPPERCIDAEELLAELEQRGSSFSVDVEEPAVA